MNVKKNEKIKFLEFRFIIFIFSMSGLEKELLERCRTSTEPVEIGDFVLYVPAPAGSPPGTPGVFRFGNLGTTTSQGPNPHPEGTFRHAIFECRRPENISDCGKIRNILVDVFVANGFCNETSEDSSNPEMTNLAKKASE